MRWRSSRAPTALVVRGGRLPLAMLVAALASACNGGQNEPTGEAAAGSDCEGRGEPIELGMQKLTEGGLYDVVLAEASPVPPLIGENSWTVDVTTSTGDPVLDDSATEDYSPVTIDVNMAEHNHDIRKSGVMTSPGVFEFLSFPVTMTGYWEFTVIVEPEGSTDPNARQGALFGVCVPAD